MHDMHVSTISTRDLIVSVLQQNRPLNAQQIADILQKSGVKKTGAQKALDAAAAAGEIICKDYGKQKIFLAKQSQFTIPSNAELEAMRKENEQLLEEGKAERTSYLKIEAGKFIIPPNNLII